MPGENPEGAIETVLGRPGDAVGRGGEDPGARAHPGNAHRQGGGRVAGLRRSGSGGHEGRPGGPAAHPSADHRPRGRARPRRRGVGRAHRPRRVPRVDRHRRREHVRDAGHGHRRRGEGARLQRLPARPRHPDAPAGPVLEPVLAAAGRRPSLPVRRRGARLEGRGRLEPPRARRHAARAPSSPTAASRAPWVCRPRPRREPKARGDGRGAARRVRAVAPPARPAHEARRARLRAARGEGRPPRDDARARRRAAPRARTPA